MFRCFLKLVSGLSTLLTTTTPSLFEGRNREIPRPFLLTFFAAQSRGAREEHHAVALFILVVIARPHLAHPRTAFLPGMAATRSARHLLQPVEFSSE